MVFILKLCTVRISSLVKADQEVFIPRCRVLAAERTMIQPSLYCGGAYEKTIVISILLCAMSLFFYSCSKPEALSVEIAETSTDAVVQGANDSLTFSAGETGVLRIKDGNLLFF